MKMRKFLLIGAASLGLTACERVPPQYVGIKVDYYGSEKGVDKTDVLGTGSYFTCLGLLSKIYTFPTWTQTTNWNTQGVDNSISFNSTEGLRLNADISISYHINPTEIINVFMRYHEGLTEISNGPLRNAVRDSFNKYASTMTAESIYGAKKDELLSDVTKDVTDKMAPLGIVVESISATSDIRMPEAVIARINAKIGAIQAAEQANYEVKHREAEARKREADAEGEAQSNIINATADAKVKMLNAQAEADANKIVAQSLTPELVQYQLVQKWNGAPPQVVSGGAGGPQTLIGINPTASH